MRLRVAVHETARGFGMRLHETFGQLFHVKYMIRASVITPYTTSPYPVTTTPQKYHRNGFWFFFKKESETTPLIFIP